MHRYSIRISLCLAIIFSTTAIENVFGLEDEVDYNARLIEVLEGYQKLIAVPLDNTVEDNTGSAWLMVSRAIKEGFLRFTIDPDSQGLLSGARFNALPGENVVHIIVTQNLLDLWLHYPATVYTVVTAVFQEAATFFQNPSIWGKARTDLMELLLIKVDGYVAQAELIQQRLLPAGYLLSPYDSYFLDSYEQDGLASVVLFLDRFSLPVIQNLYKIRLAYEESSNNEALRTSILDLGKELLEGRNQIPAKSEDQKIFSFAIAIHSWLEFTPDIIARIHNKDRINTPLTFDQILAIEKEYKTLRHQLETSRTQDFRIIERTIKDVDKKFGLFQN